MDFEDEIEAELEEQELLPIERMLFEERAMRTEIRQLRKENAALRKKLSDQLDQRVRDAEQGSMNVLRAAMAGMDIGSRAVVQTTEKLLTGEG